MSAVFENTKIVLVNTTHPGNIGGAARALKNMGFRHLCLVEPKEFPSGVARGRASGATDVLENAEVVSSLEEAIKDCELVVGTSARGRRIPWPLMTSRQCGQQVSQEAQTKRVALVFGREDRGLTNEELQQCHYHVNIPADLEYSSLNLAAAVQVLCYEVRMFVLEAMAESGDQSDVVVEPSKPDKSAEKAIPTAKLWGVDWDRPLANSKELESFFTHFEETLQKIGFLKTNNPMQVMTRMRRLFLRSRPDKVEVSMLRGILSAINKKDHD